MGTLYETVDYYLTEMPYPTGPEGEGTNFTDYAFEMTRTLDDFKLNLQMFYTTMMYENEGASDEDVAKLEHIRDKVNKISRYGLDIPHTYDGYKDLVSTINVDTPVTFQDTFNANEISQALDGMKHEIGGMGMQMVVNLTAMPDEVKIFIAKFASPSFMKWYYNIFMGVGKPDSKGVYNISTNKLVVIKGEPIPTKTMFVSAMNSPI